MVSARKVILRGQSRQIPVMFTLLHQTFSLVVAVVMALAAAVIPSWSVQVGATSATSAPPALLKMAEAERAFSKRASDATPRDAFIEFFADESVSFQPEPGSARERLRKQPAPPPGTPAFQWEPRTGDIAASGDLGYLTGPVRYPQPDGSIRHGCYFSVWKKQADGTFKVILDIGVRPPGEVPFAPGFVRSPAQASGKPASTRTEAERTLLDADSRPSARHWHRRVRPRPSARCCTAALVFIATERCHSPRATRPWRG